jgi:hypothetical protein
MNPEILASPSNNEAPARWFSSEFWTRPEARGRLLCLLIVLVAFGMRVYRLGDVALSGDEGFTHILASRDYAGLLSEIIRLGEPQPAGSFLLQKAWLDLGGRSEFNLRMLSVGFGVIAVALAYALTRKLTRSQAAAAVAAILVATNPFGLNHSREYRTYAMLACLSLACLAAFFNVARAPSRAGFVALVACEWAVIQAHYVAGFFVAGLNLAVLLWWLATRVRPLRFSMPRPPDLKGWALAQVGVVALTLPWLILARSTAESFGGTGARDMTLWNVIGAEMMLFTGQHVLTDLGMGLLLLGYLAFFAGAAALWQSSGRGRAGLLSLGVSITLPLLAVWAISWIRPIFHPRYLIVIWPLFAIIAGAGAAGRGRLRRAAGTAIAVALAAASIAGGMAYLARLDFLNPWLPLVAGFKMRNTDLPPSAIQLTIPLPDPAFGYYYPGDNVTVLPGSDRTQVGVSAQLQGFAASRIRRILTHSIVDGWWDRSNLAARFEPAPYSSVETYYFESRRFDVYERVFADRLTPLDIGFANGVRVTGVEVLTDTRWTALGLEIAFGGVAPLQGTEKVFLHVVDPAEPGRIVAQVDWPLAASHLTAAAILRGMPLPDNLARRSYDIWIGLYDPTLPGAQRIPTTSGADKALVGRLVLGRR